VIGFGGGAALDVAKVVGVAATHEGDILEYVWDHPQVRPISNPLPYFVALPTTSGTGSEVGRSGGQRERHASQAHRVQPEDPGPEVCSPTPSSRWRCRRR
jgi:alcohol dehydrogenase class IV